jgi:hypothetical protein
MKRLRGQAHGISRVIAVATAVWCLGLLARAVETSCVIAGNGIAPEAGGDMDAGVATITGIRDVARYIADVMTIPSSLAIAALATVALGSLMVIVRSRSERAGATFAALAVYGALALSRTEVAGILDGAGQSAWFLAARLGLVLGSCALAWRWIEDISLAGAIGPSDDRADLEAAHVARTGPSTTDAASRRLRDVVIGEGKRQSTVGLHGHGSPIPRVLPDQDTPVGSGRG